MLAVDVLGTFPRALASHPVRSGDTIGHLLLERIRIEPFNAVAATIFFVASVRQFVDQSGKVSGDFCPDAREL